MKAIQDKIGEKCEFESPEVIKERFGLVPGSVPPFGQLLNLDTFFDEQIMKNVRAAFNVGKLTESVIMKSEDLIQLVQPEIGHFSKE